MRYIGGVVLGSAMATITCSIFLLFCLFTVFQTLGFMLLIITFLSALAAVIPVPAALLIFGPSEPGCRASAKRVRNTFPQKEEIERNPSSRSELTVAQAQFE